MSQDPRATQVYNNSIDDEQISQVLNKMQNSSNINAFFVLSNFIDCSEIKNEPEFCQILFKEHTEVVYELFQWLLIPDQVVKSKKIKTNVDSYPYQCRQFMKDNWCFYQQMYIFARNGKFQFKKIFNFLRQQFFDKKTIYTALGYFADVMIPFAKYQFCGSFHLGQEVAGLADSKEKGGQTFSIIKIMSKELIDQLIGYCYYDPIYQFLKTCVLFSIQDPRQYDISREIIIKMFQAAKANSVFQKFPILTTEQNDSLARSVDFLENTSLCFKQMIANIEPNSADFSFRTTALLSAIVDVNFVKYAVDQISTSRLCGLVGKQKQRLGSSAGGEGTQCNLLGSGNLSVSLQYSQGFSNSIAQYTQAMLPSIGNFSPLTDADEEQIVQTFLKILSSLVEIFVRVPRLKQSLEESFDVNSPIPQTPNSDSSSEEACFNGTKFSKPKSKQFTKQEYLTITVQFKSQIQYLLDHLQVLSKFVYNEGETGSGMSFAKILPFSSGENVKAISPMKFQYFKLIHNCLLMIQIKDKDENLQGSQKQENKLAFTPLDFNIQKTHIIESIKKYLNENRWNNIVHHVLEKICHLLIMYSYEYIKKQIEKDKNNKFSSSFLAFLIENFTKRDFIFLNTVKFTSQGLFSIILGNLHSLYNIAKDLAYTLNSTNQLVLFLNEFEPWKKFIMNDLKNYEENTFPNTTKPDHEEKRESEEKEFKVDEVDSVKKVDEVDSIKKLIENISAAKKWTSKQKGKAFKNSAYDLRNSGDSFLKSETSQHMVRTQDSNQVKQKYLLNYNRKKMGLQEILFHKILNKKVSEVKQFDVDEIFVRDKLAGEQKRKHSKDEMIDSQEEDNVHQVQKQSSSCEIKSQRLLKKQQTKEELNGQGLEKIQQKNEEQVGVSNEKVQSK